MVPLLKDKTGDVSSLNNYRGITLIPTISKVFELTLRDRGSSVFVATLDIGKALTLSIITNFTAL